MKPFSVVFAVWISYGAGLAGQSAPPTLVVRVDTAGSQKSQLQPLPVTRLDDSAAAAILDAPRAMALRFSTPQPVRQVLMMLVRDTGLSLVAAGDADGMFAGELTGVTLRQALDLVIKPQGLDYRIEGNAIRVFRRETVMRILDVNAIAARRPGNESGDTFDDLGKSLGTLLSGSGRLGLDRKAGLMHVTDYPENVERVAGYIESLERRLNRQVDIKARVIEVLLPDAGAPGVNWNEALGQARAAGPGSNVIDLNRLVSALSKRGTVNILTAADVTALHNEQATIRLGVQSPAFAGFALSVTPHIAADGTVLMSVSPTVAQPLGDDGRASSPSSAMTTSEISTAVRVHDGETLVLPGIRRARSEIAVLLTTKVM